MYIVNSKNETQIFNHINSYVQMVETNKLLTPVTVIYKKLPINTLVQVEGYLYYIGGKTNERCCINPAISLILDGKAVNLYKKMEKIAAGMNDVTCEQIGVSREDSQAFFEMLLLKFKSLIFMKNESLVKKLSDINKPDKENGQTIKDKIMKVDIAKQVGIYQDLIAFVSGSRTTFPNIKEVMTLSRATIPLDISKYSQFNIITQSVTGLYEQSIPIIEKAGKIK